MSGLEGIPDGTQMIAIRLLESESWTEEVALVDDPSMPKITRVHTNIVIRIDPPYRVRRATGQFKIFGLSFLLSSDLSKDVDTITAFAYGCPHPGATPGETEHDSAEHCSMYKADVVFDDPTVPPWLDVVTTMLTNLVNAAMREEMQELAEEEGDES